MAINGNTTKIVKCLALMKYMYIQMRYLWLLLPYNIDHIENEIDPNQWSLVSSEMIFDIVDDH